MSKTPAVPSIFLKEYALNAYLRYAMSVVRGRAIPDVEDGLKPVQRRILFAMRDLQLGGNAKPKKSARVVGDVIGKYHPHGDSSVYEAMVIMSQKFKLRYPLVHGEGNFGDIDDPKSFAAMRYTEVKLAPISSALLDELAWDTVDYNDNFDGTLKEPELMPGRLPFLLLNATPGVGVGMASSFVPHQLNEVVEAAKLMLLNPKATLDQVMEKLPGPDFPGGGRLISSVEDIRRVYTEGRGVLRVRSQWRVEDKGKGRWVLHVYELPPEVSPAKIMGQLGALMAPKPRESKKGKAAKDRPQLTPEQIRLKKLFGELVEEFKDLSTGGGIDLAFFPKDRKMDPEALMRTLCAHTDLEAGVPANLVSVDRHTSPRVGGLLDWLGQWCDFRVETVHRRLTDEKKRVDHRLHILDGRLSILDRIEEVIQVLRTSTNPKQDLMESFGLSEIQAEDVLDMRLRQVANLEKTKLKEERERQRAEQDRLAKLLDSDKAIRKLIIQELDKDAKQFGDTRRTELLPDDSTSAKKVIQEHVSDKLAPEPIAVALTERGWIAWRPAKSMEEAQSADFKIKSGDNVRRIFFGDRNDHLLLLDDHGKAYSLHLTELPSKADTLPLTNWFAPGDRHIIEGAIGHNDSLFLLASTGGLGFLIQGKQWIARVRAGKDCFVLTEGAKPLPPQPIPNDPEATKRSVVCLASDGRAVAFDLGELKIMPKAKGFGLMGLVAGETMADAVVVPADQPVGLLTDKGSVSLPPSTWGDFMGKRSSGKKGKALHKHSKGAVFIRPGREEAMPPVSS